MVFVLVEVAGRTEELAFVAAMRAAPAVMECHHIAGEFSYLLKMRVRRRRPMRTFLERHSEESDRHPAHPEPDRALQREGYAQAAQAVRGGRR